MIGGVIHQQKYPAPVILGEQSFEKGQKAAGIEDLGEVEGELRRAQADGREQVCRLTRAKRIDSRLPTDARPGSMQGAVKPEAGFVFEHNDAAAGRGFFFIAGKVSFSQVAWRSASAFASRLRGRCTENPSLCSKRGM